MKIRTQLIMSTVFFVVALAIISASVISTNQHVERLNKQEELAKNIELRVAELGYLSNDYILYHESQQIDRWESKYSLISGDVSNLTASSPKQQVLVDDIKASGQRLKNIFGDIVSEIENGPENQQNTANLDFVEVSWSRMGVQTQGMVFDASRLSEMLREEADQARQQNNMLILALIGAFVVFLFTDYLLIFRRTLKSVSNLQDGTRIIGLGNLDYSLEEKKDDEIGELAQAFNLMTANLKTVTASKADLEREIVERKRAEEAQHQAYGRLQTFFDHRIGGIGIVIANARGDVLQANDYYLSILGCTREELLSGQVDWRKMTPPEWLAADERALAQLRERGVCDTYEKEYMRQDGTRVPVSITDAMMPGDRGDILAFIFDITERKKSEEELRESRKRLAIDLDAMTRLQKLSTLFVLEGDLEPILDEIVDTAIAISGADFGNIQILETESSNLKIVASRGFPEWWIDFWNSVSKGQGACGTALEHKERIIVEDVEQSPIFVGTPALEIQLNAGVRAVQSTPLMSRSGRPLGMFSTHYKTPHRPDDHALRLLDLLARQAADIIERKQSEEERQHLALELADRVALLQAVLDAAPVAVWIAHDPKCQRITGNIYADQILHAPSGGNVSCSASPEDAAVSFKVFRNGVELQPEEMPAQVATATGKPVMGSELELIFPDGRTVYLIESAVPLFDAEGQVRGAVIAGSDVTELKLAEEALRRSRDELEQRVQERTAELFNAKEELELINEKLHVRIEAQRKAEENLLAAKEAAEAATRAKAEFLANMSHEIRTPMNSIIGFTELLLDEPLTPVQKENLEIIRVNGDALLTIINDILDFSKMESDKLVLEDQPFNLRQCVEESMDLISIKASKKGLNVSYTFDKGVPDTIIGDLGRLRQVLANLLSNAVKFTDEGEVKISVSSQQMEGTNEVHFAVSDTGIGIPQGSMHQLFQSFSQMEPSTTRFYGGTGLGLAISKNLVELMGGRIWAESEEGIGSTFHFTIRAPSGPVEPQRLAVSPQLIGKHVLIIQDNKTNRRILSKQIYDWGMVPMAAKSGREALSWVLRGDDFYIAILDMDSQDMNPLELEEKISKYNKTLPLVLLTSPGKRMPPNKAYLTKPIKPSQLHKVLTDILSRTDILPEEPAKSLAKASGVDQPILNSSLRILLAEDDISGQKVAQMMLKKLGYKSDTVANGIEALQALERQHYDVVLMDVKMPEMDGLEAAHIIRQRWPDGPKIIAITAYALRGDREKFIEAGMDDYIAKPVEINDLRAVLERNSIGKNRAER
jgi:PAS domain S-box-containing protein